MKNAFIISVLAISFLLPTANAHAVFGLGGCGTAGAGGAAAGAASRATSVPVLNTIIENNTTIQTVKECILDGLAFVLSEALISQITDNIISWINSGFEGGPAYVTDLSGFLGEIADTEASNFIQGSELGNVCSTFEQPIRRTLARQYELQKSFSRQISCTAEGSSGNFDAFLDGDFTQGGWQAWFRLATNPQNNPIGAYLIAESELNSRIASKQSEELRLLDYGDGFFSKGECVYYGESARTTEYNEDGVPVYTVTPSLNTQRGCEADGGTWEIVTPGTQVNSLLSRWLGVSADKLAAADEIDEILNALLAQLSQQIFTSLDGLRGLSSNTSSSSFNGQSYVRNLSQGADTATLAQARSVLISDISNAIASEEVYGEILNEIIIGYSAAKSNFEAVYAACSNSNTSLAATATSTLNSAVIPLLTDYQNQHDVSSATIVQLTSIRNDAQVATTPETLNAAANQYQTLIDSGVIHTDSDIFFLANERDAQQGTFDNYYLQANTDIAVCGGTL